MRCAFSILIVALVGASSAKATPVRMIAQASMDNSLAQYLLQRSAASVADNPADSIECFRKFLPMLTQIDDDYSTQYQACITLSKKQIMSLNTLASVQRANLNLQMNSICGAIQDCGNDSDIQTLFNCYAAPATKDVSVVFQLSSDATDAAKALTLGLRTAQVAEEACKNATQRNYVANTAETYQLLDECLGDGATTEDEPASTATTDATTTTTTAPDVAQVMQIVERTQCSNVSVTHTQTSANGSQTQSQTGPGCQSQSTGSGAGQNQTQSGNGTQSQCSGADCGEWKPLFPPMKPMEPMAPMKPMEPMAPMKPLEPMAPMEPLEPMAPMKPMEPMAPMKPMEPMAPMKPLEGMTPMKPMEGMAPMKPMEPMAPMEPMEPMPPMQPMEGWAPMNPMEGMPPMKPMEGWAPMKPMEPMIIDED